MCDIEMNVKVGAYRLISVLIAVRLRYYFTARSMIAKHFNHESIEQHQGNYMVQK